MSDHDARNQTLAELHERRKQVIRLHKKGYGIMRIVELTNLSWPAVRTAIDLYEADGMAALKPKERGKKVGEGRSLTPDQEALIRKLICDRRPEQLKMDFALWTRAAVGELIARACGIKLKVRAVGNDLKRWGFTPQKPIKRAYEQRPAAVKAWIDEQYPAIAARAKAEGGEVQWGDETALVNTDVRGRSYAPKGETPVAYAPGTRQKLSMISTVTNRGKARWMIIDGNFGTDRLIEFFTALIKATRRKIFLILDNLRAHHAKPVKEWLAERKDRIEVFYLPSYAPELNPDERLNADLKREIRKRVPVRTKGKLKAAAEQHMAEIEKSPARIRSYFQDARVKYAA
ncbi:MAG: IS630 family transposase [Terriglobales bacterium]